MDTYGLLGNKIEYSLSPLMQNAAFKALKLEAEYKFFDIPEKDLEKFFSDFKTGAISGCNVTIPYKETALKLVDVCDKLAEEIRAVNTIVLRSGKLYGYNTDFQGFVEALRGRNEGDLNFDSQGKSAFLFGAGGAAKAVIYALIDLGIKKIAIADIDEAKAEGLASYITKRKSTNFLVTVVKDKAQYEEFISRSDLLVNATPCGIKKTDQALFDYRYIHEKLYVFDLIYAHETPLAKEAKTRGAKAINGMNMLLYQAGASFAIWTGKAAPISVMREAVLEKIRR